MKSVAFEIPMRLQAGPNQRLHWATRAKRVAAERAWVALCFPRGWGSVCTYTQHGLIVTLVRIAPREVDGDNLQGLLKGVRDEVALRLGLASDRDERVAWVYGQESGTSVNGDKYAVRIELVMVPADVRGTRSTGVPRQKRSRGSPNPRGRT